MNNKITPLLFFLLGLTGSTTALAEPSYDTPQTKAFAQRVVGDIKAGKLIEISAAKLISEYQSNEVVADSKFKDKFLFVGGTVESVSKNFAGNIVLSLRGGNQFNTVMASFDTTVGVISGLEGTNAKVVTMKAYPLIEAVSMVKRGARVHLICRGDGFLIAIPQLRKCDTISR